ncbi:MAG: DUF3192 domain-containing protein [Gammaproteobacteria bacterium]|nr:DUF3192 domain-containing protein [Gammaproteobacteria bacterium]MBU1555865.1 DUF3192 domain-containing protein [Gammaproteobacteria bacterium]MBU2071457.1 DUF3192 domain-containing protein [Gammaproteobacteria bacterium]MBU2182469.1 DUF3192 domain-containing protein [Gammaproteobacteria bacterium]MBU2205851.1 DUF3192 domain-containing protein [Gammaproteobacteria bacterium]
MPAIIYKLVSNKLVWMTAGLLLYILLTLAALHWYPDNVEQMNWADREVFNAKVIRQYNAQGSIQQQQVLDRLGSPDITAAFNHHADIYQVLYYRTHRRTPDGITTADECTALLFKNRLLIAIGDTAVSRYQSLSANAR